MPLFRWALLALCACLVLPGAARAIDLDAERAAARVLSRALDAGGAGDWAGAQTIAAGSGDPVIQDIVLWRKLRAGQGSPAEFEGYVSRRPLWPGRDQIEEALFGGGSGREPLEGAAAAAWSRFSAAWERDDYETAEQLMIEATAAGQLGVPARWAERRRALTRRAAREGRAQNAYALAANHGLTEAAGFDYSDNEWLAGWVALRKLGDPARAIPHFERFTQSVETPISLGRGGYWLGRAHEAAGNADQAREWYGRGAFHLTSFYGQLAAAKIGATGDPAMPARDLPEWRTSPAIRGDDVRCAVLLHFAGEDSLALATFSELGRAMQGQAAVGALAHLALDLGKPHYAVRVAKAAVRRGIVLYPAYYPVTELSTYARAVEPAFAMAIARQETELNDQAISPAGAMGLMQLMPGTAQIVARQIGETYSKSRLTEDWQYNARLGQNYLAEQISDFGGSYALAAAAYNAGPARVRQWIGEFGDPRLPGVDFIDWLESIPFNETRDYVQRVMEALYVYRTRISGEVQPLSLTADLARGVRQ